MNIQLSQLISRSSKENVIQFNQSVDDYFDFSTFTGNNIKINILNKTDGILTLFITKGKIENIGNSFDDLTIKINGETKDGEQIEGVFKGNWRKQ